MANSNGWGDGAANNSIGWGQGANNAIAWGDSHAKSWAGATDIVGITTDPDAQAFITAAAITDPTQQTAIDTLVKGMKADGLWTKMKAIYPFVGGTASAHKWNLKDPRDLDAAFRLVFNGGWTHSANGATPNGTNGYADTKLNDSILTPNSSHMSYYSRSNIITNTYEIGIYNGTRGIWFALANASGPAFTGGIFQAGASGEASVSNTNSTGYYIGGKNGSTTTKFYKNGTNVVSIAKADTTATNTSIYLASLNQNGTPSYGFSNKQVAFSSIGDGLTDTEAANLYTRVQAFQTALSRQV